MWLPGGLLYLALVCLYFVLWLRSMDSWTLMDPSPEWEVGK
jgi:hypothetical protein